MDNFIPSNYDNSQQVPYFEDVDKESGWQGQGTTKSIETLKSEIAVSITRLGGLVTGFIYGTFGERDGYRITYLIETKTGEMLRGQIDVAALPIRTSPSLKGSEKTRRDKSLRMALYMLRTALDGTRFLQALSPGYIALMPWMLTDGNRTVSQRWAEKTLLDDKQLESGKETFDED